MQGELALEWRLWSRYQCREESTVAWTLDRVDMHPKKNMKKYTLTKFISKHRLVLCIGLPELPLPHVVSREDKTLREREQPDLRKTIAHCACCNGETEAHHE